MKKWYLKCASFETVNDIFDAIRSGAKTIETRPVSPGSSRNPANFKEGDVLVFKSLDTDEETEKIVDFVRVYVSVDELAINEDPQKIFPDVNSHEELVRKFGEAKKKWGSKYAQKLEKYGIVAIRII